MELITLNGKAYEIGKIYGGLLYPVFKQHLARVYSHAKRKSISKNNLQQRTKRLRRILKNVAPYWLEEMQGICSETKINPMDILILNSLPENFYKANCTSFIAIGNSSKTGENILHKNRDELPHLQSFFLKEINGCFRYLAGGTIGDLGISHFLNEKGLAGANNSGSRIKLKEINGVGLSDCHIMRLVAEKASSCEEALKLVKRIITQGFCGQAGGGRGMIFLFVDKDKGLIVENTSYHLTYQWIKKGKEVRANDFILPGAKRWILRENPASRSLKSSQTRYKRGKELLEKEGKISSSFLRKVSRDPKNYPFSICNDNQEQPTMTLSAFTHLIRKKATDLLSLSWVCNGSPFSSFYFPYYVGGLSSLKAHLDGQFNQTVYKIFKKKNKVSQSFLKEQEKWEEKLEKEEAAVIKEITESWEKKRFPELRRKLDTYNLNWVERTFEKQRN